MSWRRSSGSSLLAILCGGALLVAGCTEATERRVSPAPTPSPATRSSAALAVETVFSLPGIGTGPCRIVRGGPPGPAAVLTGTCETRVERSGDNWLVILVETWDASDFRGQGAPAVGPLSHSWEFTVGSEGGIVAQRNWGDYPPQAVF